MSQNVTPETVADTSTTHADEATDIHALAVARVRDALQAHTLTFRQEVLSRAMAEVQQAFEPVAALNAMEAEIRDVVGRMTPRERALIGILLELASLEGVSVGVEFGHELVYGDLADADAIGEALAESPDDPDLNTMQRAYELARTIADGAA